MTEVEKHLNLLGLNVRDKVTGISGVVTSVSFDLYGCVQCLVTGIVTDPEKEPLNYWMDVGRLVTKGKKPVMVVPNFDYGVVAEGKKGPAHKPLP